MKRLFIYVCIVVGGILQSCVIKYERLTHLNEDDLEWVTNRYIGEVIYFQSQDGLLDTLQITEIKILNSTNSINWNYYIHGDNTYLANASVDFSFRDKKAGNCFYIEKKFNDKPIYYGAELFKRWTPATQINDTCMQVNKITLNDVVFFDESVMRPVNEYNPEVPITSFAWSKKYGLVQYTFQDGTEFNRIDLNK